MKKTVLSFTLLAAAAAAVVPNAANGAAAEQPIRVFMEGGSQVEFKVNPVLQNGRTLVEFRSIFEELGLDIKWDPTTRTVTGKGNGLEIILQIDNKTATVNGKKVVLDVAPQIIKNSTFVPLRFIGEAAGMEVSWDGFDRTILIAPVEYQLEWVLTKNVYYTQQENLNGVLSTLDPSNPEFYAALKSNLAQQFAVFDFDYTIHNIELLKLDGDTASVRMELETNKVKGPEFHDYIAGSIQELTKINGAWKVGAGSLVWVDYMLEDKFPNTNPTIEEAVKKELTDTLAKYVEVSEKEDLEAMKSYYEPSYPNLDQLMIIAKEKMSQLDLAFELTNLEFLDAKDKQITVRYRLTVNNVGTYEGYPNHADDIVEIWVKTDKGWKVKFSDTLFREYLN